MENARVSCQDYPQQLATAVIGNGNKGCYDEEIVLRSSSQCVALVQFDTTDYQNNILSAVLAAAISSFPCPFVSVFSSMALKASYPLLIRYLIIRGCGSGLWHAASRRDYQLCMSSLIMINLINVSAKFSSSTVVIISLNALPSVQKY